MSLKKEIRLLFPEPLAPTMTFSFPNLKSVKSRMDLNP